MNLCVSLAKAYTTPLPVSIEESKGETSPVPQQAGAKKGAKGDPQPPSTSSGSSGAAATTIKSEDAKAALEVNNSIMKYSLTHVFFSLDKRCVNTPLIKQMKK